MSGAEIIEGDRLGALLPHAGEMRLIERIESWTATGIRCTTLTHRSMSNPLRRDGRLSAVHLVEYAAQAMALHGALFAGGKAQPGMLAGVRDVRLHTAHLDSLTAPLVVSATRRMAQRDGLLYEYAVHCAGTLLSTGRIAIALDEVDG